MIPLGDPLARASDLDEWRREVASMTEQQRSVTETDCRRALGMCGDVDDAR